MKIDKQDKFPDEPLKAKNKAQSQEPNLHKKAVENAIYERRAREFQAMHNPMSQTPFELELTNNERNERWDNKKNYISGIQGVDGGRCAS